MINISNNLDKSFVKSASNNNLEVTQNDFKKIEKEFEKLKVQYTKLNAKMNRVLNEKKVIKRSIKETSKKLHEHVKNHRNDNLEYLRIEKKYDKEISNLKLEIEQLKKEKEEMKRECTKERDIIFKEINDLKIDSKDSFNVSGRTYRFVKALAYSLKRFKSNSVFVEDIQEIREYLKEFDLRAPRDVFNDMVEKKEKEIIYLGIFSFIKQQQIVCYKDVEYFVQQKYKKLTKKTVSTYVQKLATKHPDLIEIKKDEKIQNKKHIILYKENIQN